MSQSRWAHWSRGTEEKLGFSSFIKEATDTGNPTGTGMMSPADRARQLGLQSDGSGGYIDPKTGEVVAKTVNGELVFYDKRGASGGVVADGSGGEQLTQSQPSWSDPRTGMITTPPAQPESPEELAAVPDATPATSPAGYSDFMKKKKDLAYAEPEEMENPGDMEGGIPAMAGMIGGDMGFGDAGGAMGEDYTPQDLQQRSTSTPEKQVPPERRMLDLKNKAMAKPKPEVQPEVKPEVKPEVQPEVKPEGGPSPEPNEKEMKRREQLTTALQGLINSPERKKGAGANDLSDEDITKFVDYINNGSKVEKVPVTEEEMIFANKYLKDNLGKKWSGLQNRLKGKGDPEAARKVVARAQEVLKSYLENLGQSSIDGTPLAFSESELDHVMSLDNGGLDQGDNWAWLPKRFNQVKGALSDQDLLDKLQKMRAVDPRDKQLKQQEKSLVNKMRGDWKERYQSAGWDDLNQGDIRAATGAQGLQQLKALAEVAGVSYYKDRGVTRSSGRAGGGTQLGVEELQDRLIDQLMIPEKADFDAWDETLFATLQELEDGRSDLAGAKKVRAAEKRAEKKKAKMKESVYSWLRGEKTLNECVDDLM